MKKAFTLVELLVVVVVIAILASIVFRIAGLGEASKKRNVTVSRLQKLENAISGYFAAYGSYPPVALQGRSRNIYYPVNSYGIQQVSRNSDTSEIEWSRVEAACRSQPVACEFPFKAGMHEYVKEVSDALVKSGKEDMVFDALDNPEQLNEKRNKGDWVDTQLFKFGLISYLLPRYLVMMGYGAEEQNTTAAANLYDGFAQWGDNNSMPCRFEDGVQYESWSDLNTDLGRSYEKWKVALLPSQAVCARWIANLEGILKCFNPAIGSIYGVNVKTNGGGISIKNPPSPKQIYSSGESQNGEGGGRSQPYVLDQITCEDGWGNEFYYYSPPPYQGYRLWSAGPNGRTFPPWFPDREIEELKERNMIRNWLSDDIVHMRN